MTEQLRLRMFRALPGSEAVVGEELPEGTDELLRVFAQMSPEQRASFLAAGRRALVQGAGESVDLDAFVARVAGCIGIETERLKSRDNSHALVDMRTAIAFYLVDELGVSYPGVAKALGGKHHSTYVHHVARFKDEKLSAARMKRVRQVLGLIGNMGGASASSAA